VEEQVERRIATEEFVHMNKVGITNISVTGTRELTIPNNQWKGGESRGGIGVSKGVAIT